MFYILILILYNNNTSVVYILVQDSRDTSDIIFHPPSQQPSMRRTRTLEWKHLVYTDAYTLCVDVSPMSKKS